MNTASHTPTRIPAITQDKILIGRLFIAFANATVAVTRAAARQLLLSCDTTLLGATHQC